MKEKFTCDILILKNIVNCLSEIQNVTKHSVYYLLKLANIPKVDSILLRKNSHTHTHTHTHTEGKEEQKHILKQNIHNRKIIEKAEITSIKING